MAELPLEDLEFEVGEAAGDSDDTTEGAPTVVLADIVSYGW